MTRADDAIPREDLLRELDARSALARAYAESDALSAALETGPRSRRLLREAACKMASAVAINRLAFDIREGALFPVERGGE